MKIVKLLKDSFVSYPNKHTPYYKDIKSINPILPITLLLVLLITIIVPNPITIMVFCSYLAFVLMWVKQEVNRVFKKHFQIRKQEDNEAMK